MRLSVRVVERLQTLDISCFCLLAPLVEQEAAEIRHTHTDKMVSYRARVGVDHAFEYINMNISFFNIYRYININI